jgi:hypothetical protein
MYEDANKLCRIDVVGHEVADPKASRGHFLLWLTYGFSLEYSQGRRGLELTEPQPQMQNHIISGGTAPQRCTVASDFQGGFQIRPQSCTLEVQFQKRLGMQLFPMFDIGSHCADVGQTGGLVMSQSLMIRDHRNFDTDTAAC